MDDGYEVSGEPPRRARPVARAVPRPTTPADDAGGYGLIDEPPAERPKPNLRPSLADDVVSEPDDRWPSGADKPLPAADEMASQLYGMLLVAAGVWLLVRASACSARPRRR